jgi:hypothetical protein
MHHIQELLERAIKEAENGNPDFCILLESRSSPDRWVQLKWDAVNAAYPFAGDPLAKIRELKLPEFPYLEVEEWEPNRFAIFAHGADAQDQIATFVALYFERALAVNPAIENLRIEEQ